MAMNALRFVFRLLFRRHQLERELNDELASHIAMETSLRMQEGESPEAARQAALRQFGNLGLVAEVTRSMWGFHVAGAGAQGRPSCGSLLCARAAVFRDCDRHSCTRDREFYGDLQLATRNLASGAAIS